MGIFSKHFHWIVFLWMFLCFGRLTWAQTQNTAGVAPSVEYLGFRVFGKGRLHLFTSLDLRFDSNPSFASVSSNINPDLILAIKAGSSFEIASERLIFNIRGQIDWMQYLGAFQKETKSYSGIQGNAAMRFATKNLGAWTISLSDAFSRTVSPSNAALNARILYLTNDSSLRFDYAPFNKAVSANVSYGFLLNWFDANQQGLPASAAMSSMSHRLQLGTVWKFLPKTGLQISTDLGMVRYPNRDASIVNYDSHPVRASIGLVGYLSNKLTVNAYVGYGNSLSLNADKKLISSFSNVVALAQISWRLSDPMSINAGYSHDFSATNFFTSQEFHRAFLNYSYAFWSHLQLSIQGQYDYQTMRLPTSASSALLATRHDHVIRFDSRLSFRIKKWLGGALFYIPEIRLTDAKNKLPTGDLVSASYSKHTAGFDLTLAY